MPAPAGATVAPLPAGSRGRRGGRTRLLIIGVVIVVVLVGIVVIGTQLAKRNSRFTIVTSQSTDGTFHGGDCVTLTATEVHQADCTSTRDGQIIRVIHNSESCVAGTDTYKVQDGTGDLCIDKGNSKH